MATSPFDMHNDEDSDHVGRRVSYKGHRCTIRYYGEVEGKPGKWFGVQWDDERRGKHDGTWRGERYFSCKLSWL